MAPAITPSNRRNTRRPLKSSGVVKCRRYIHTSCHAGGIASRSSLVRLVVNGQYDGLRYLTENLDREMLRAQGLPKGSLYREITWAHLGHDDVRTHVDVWPREAKDPVTRADQSVLAPVVRSQPVAVVATVELDDQPRGRVVKVRASHKGPISVVELNLDLRSRHATTQQ